MLFFSYRYYFVQDDQKHATHKNINKMHILYSISIYTRSVQTLYFASGTKELERQA